tara:strand:+ start:94631 stop:94873 length:243 start_codon:yes stop_codon:yes gene_type:complete
MLNLNEFKQIETDVAMLEEKIDESVYEKSETFELTENENLTTTFKLYDADDNCIFETEVEDYYTAEQYLKERFDISGEEE